MIRITDLIGCVLHPSGQALPLDIAGCLGRRPLLALLRRRTSGLSRSGCHRSLLQTVLHSFCARGQPLLFASQPAKGVLSRGAPTSLRQVGGSATLGVRQLASLKLKVAKVSTLLVWAALLELLLKRLQLGEGARTPRTGLGWILTSKLAGRIAHFV